MSLVLEDVLLDQRSTVFPHPCRRRPDALVDPPVLQHRRDPVLARFRERKLHRDPVVREVDAVTRLPFVFFSSPSRID